MSKRKKSETKDIFAFIERYGKATIAEDASAKEKLAFIEKHFENAIWSYHTAVTIEAQDITIAVQKTLGMLK
jgi:hypothetical protein